MARRAIISDIHGNLVALEAVLADIQTQGADEIVCLGDICGYGPQPVECVDRVRSAAAWTLLGNHDEALWVEPKDFSQNARLAIEWQRTIMEPKADSPADVTGRWAWLKSLQPQRQERDVLYVHGSPRDPLYEYVLRENFHDSGLGPVQSAKDIFAAMEWLCFCGHSHRPGVVAEDYKWWRPSELENGTAAIKPGFKTIVNVGSVGQPRDGIPAACYVLFDYTPPAESSKATRADLPAVGAQPVAGGAGSSAPTPVNTPSPDASGRTNGATLIQRRPAPPPPPQDEKSNGAEEETRFGPSPLAGAETMVRARETALLNTPRVTFRRVDYNVAEAQARFRAVPQLPDALAVRLAKAL